MSIISTIFNSLLDDKIINKKQMLLNKFNQITTIFESSSKLMFMYEKQKETLFKKEHILNSYENVIN